MTMGDDDSPYPVWKFPNCTILHNAGVTRTGVVDIIITHRHRHPSADGHVCGQDAAIALLPAMGRRYALAMYLAGAALAKCPRSSSWIYGAAPARAAGRSAALSSGRSHSAPQQIAPERSRTELMGTVLDAGAAPAGYICAPCFT